MSFILRISSFAKNQWPIMLAVAVIVYMICSWLYKLGTYPGLHADEAWFGLEALKSSATSRNELTGMTYYTGTLQIYANKLIFITNGVSVFSLRLSGVICNTIGLILLWLILHFKRSPMQALLFVLIVSQSSLFLTSPKVAWEVNSFSLLLSSLLLLSLIFIVNENKLRPFAIFGTLLICVLGSYNHIIFFVVPLAILLSVVIQFLLTGKSSYLSVFVILIVAIIDIVLQLLFFKYGKFWWPNVIGYVIFTICIIIFQTFCLKFLNIRFKLPPKYKLNPKAIKYFILAALIAFLIFHGKAFFEILSGYKVFFQYYALESSQWVKLVSDCCSIFFALYFLHQVFKGVYSEDDFTFSLFLFSYIAIFCFFTTGNSYRYYLQSYIIFAVYVSITSVRKNNFFAIFFVTCFTLFFSLYTQSRVYNVNRHDKAVDFTIGNKQQETSAHFLNKTELVTFLRDEKIDSMIFMGMDPYFIRTPIEFYRHIYPWNPIRGKSAVILLQSSNKDKNGILFFLGK